MSPSPPIAPGLPATHSAAHSIQILRLEFPLAQSHGWRRDPIELKSSYTSLTKVKLSKALLDTNRNISSTGPLRNSWELKNAAREPKSGPTLLSDQLTLVFSAGDIGSLFKIVPNVPFTSAAAAAGV